MKWLRYSIAVELLVLCTATAHAGSDPIGWSLSANLPAQTYLNEVYNGYTYTIINNMPFTMPSPLYIKKKVNGEFTVTDHCSGLKLASKQTCTVGFNFVPTANGNKTLDIALEYDSNIVHLPTVLTTTSTKTTLITGIVSTPLPATIGLSQPPVNVLLTFVNQGGGTISNVTDTHSYPAGFTPGTNTCSGLTTFGPTTSCTVAGTFTTDTAGTYMIGYTLSYTGGQTAISTSTVAAQDVSAVATTPLPDNIGTGTNTPVVFTFKNNGNGTISGVTAPTIAAPTGFTYTNNCTSSTLDPGQACTVTGNLNVGTPGPYSIMATFNYNGGTVPVTTSTTANVDITAVATTPLAANISTGTPTPFVFTFTNTGNGTVTGITPPVITSAPDGFTYTNNCTTTTLGANQKCTITGSLNADLEQDYSITATFNYDGGSVPVSTSTTTSIGVAGSATGPSSVSAGSANNYTFTFTNNGTGTITGITTPTVSTTPNNGDFVATNHCTSSTMTVGKSCTVTGVLTPGAVGPYVVTVTFNYDGGQVPFPDDITSVQAITGTVSTPLPTNIPIGLPGTTAAFTFTNTGTTTVSGVTAPTVTATGATYSPTITNCSGSLIPNASCTISGMLIVPSTGDYTINTSFNYTGPAVPLSASTDATGRLFTIINKSNNTVWFSFNGAAITGSTCTTNADCPTGSNCQSSICYWNNPVPTSGSLSLAPNAQTSLILPDSDLTSPPVAGFVWQGQIAAQTQCSGSSCLTGDCQSNGGTTSCAVGATFKQPATVANFTLLRSASDTYYVDTSGGVNVGLAIDPLSNTTPSDYTCGNPGNPEPNNLKLTSLGACHWMAGTTNPAKYTWVEAVAFPTACTDNSNCTSPQDVCGLSYSTSQSPTFQQTCGPQLGYWTANTACSLNAADANAFFSCQTALTQTSGTLTDLYACDSQLSGSCYATGAANTCCGCQNWTNPAQVPASTALCVNSNSDWTANVLGKVNWLKEICPTARVYPYDTASSTFSCATTGSSTNATSYTITFYPTTASS